MNDLEIVKLYEEQKKSPYAIAKILGTYANEVRRKLVKLGVKLRDKKAAQKNALETGAAKHPTAGKQRTQAEKVKISAKLSEHWDRVPESEKKAKVKAAKERWKALPASKKAQITAAAIAAIQEAGKSGSKLEKVILKRLSDAGFRAEFHKTNLLANEKLEIDLYIPALKTIIEVDGPSHFLPVWGERKLQNQIRADSQKSGLILSRGFAIIRVKVLDNLTLAEQERVITKIIATLNNIKESFPPQSQRFIEVEA